MWLPYVTLSYYMQFRATNRAFTCITLVSTHYRCLTCNQFPDYLQYLSIYRRSYVYTHVFPYCHALRTSIPLMVLIVIHATQNIKSLGDSSDTLKENLN